MMTLQEAAAEYLNNLGPERQFANGNFDKATWRRKNVGNFSAIIHARAFSYRPWTSTTSSPAWGGPGGAGALPAKFRLI